MNSFFDSVKLFKAAVHLKTRMMWPPQNFLLYNGTIIKIKVNEWINNLKNIYYVSPPPLWGYIQPVQIITILISKKNKRFQYQ